MTGAELVVKKLIDEGITDVFGVPGGVVLPLLYALEDCEGISPRLGYNEQASGFAAIGYAQASGRPGAAYATRGPGIMNMLTAMAEAYYESAPVVFLTAHANASKKSERRTDYDQETDIISVAASFTKYAAAVEKSSDLGPALDKAIKLAKDGRKGPALLDIAHKVLVNAAELECDLQDEIALSDKNDEGLPEKSAGDKEDEAAARFKELLLKSKRPVFLIGDGVRQAGAVQVMRRISAKCGIPAVSSRGAQDILTGSELYFGYIGSHGVRYANCILDSADCVIALGNRLSFPLESESYGHFFENRELLHIDIDPAELTRFGKGRSFCMDVKSFLEKLSEEEYEYPVRKEWLSECKRYKEAYRMVDMPVVVKDIIGLLEDCGDCRALVCDVGNTEFWVARAYEYLRPAAPMYVSKSFGTLGSGVGKAIGAYYALRKPVVLISGDQGLQFGVNELMHIGKHKLPIRVVIVNNGASGMIRDSERRKHKADVHTTDDTGYGTPDFESLAAAYGLSYICVEEGKALEGRTGLAGCGGNPILLELKVDRDEELTPYLPRGNKLSGQYPHYNNQIIE
ncbi:MAG: thiamine pyrophosphate-binding protein [Lachnospiraceae bacterium]|nr:thiamine pyrophosphate-binding protein [Lachnospiraceae bacterium]